VLSRTDIKHQKENLSSVQHEIWSRWMRYLFDKCLKNEDGSYLIPSDFVKRWERQMNTNYEQLSEKEKESDREIAQIILDFLLSLYEKENN